MHRLHSWKGVLLFLGLCLCLNLLDCVGQIGGNIPREGTVATENPLPGEPTTTDQAPDQRTNEPTQRPQEPRPEPPNEPPRVKEPTPQEPPSPDAPRREPGLVDEPPLEDAGVPESSGLTEKPFVADWRFGNKQTPPKPSLPSNLETLVPAIVAYGHGQRLTISCDDGKSWQGHSVAFTPPSLGDPYGYDYASSGWWASALLYHKSAWILARGNKRPSFVYRSTDGMGTWKKVFDQGDVTLPGFEPQYQNRIALANGVAAKDAAIVGDVQHYIRSTDGGRTWTIPKRINHMRLQMKQASQYVYSDTKTRLIVLSDFGLPVDTSVGSDRVPLFQSDDQGTSFRFLSHGKSKQRWWCMNQTKGTHRNGAFLFVSGLAADAATGRPDGPLCVYSADQKWSYGSLGKADVRHVMTVGNNFRAYTPSGVLESADGKTWKSVQSTGLSLFHPSTMLIFRHPTSNTYIGYSNTGSQHDAGWFLRSTDGLSWTRLPNGYFPTFGEGAAIRQITTGQVKARLCLAKP